MKTRYFLFMLLMLLAYSDQCRAQEQTALGSDIRTIKLYKLGDQTSFPALVLNSGDALELDFDDMGNKNKNYYFTYELCNADWTPSILHFYEYIKGFQTTRISLYRNSSIAMTPYIHYQVMVPDKNSTPSRSGNYLLKVFLDNDTGNLVFTKRFVVVDTKVGIQALLQQPYSTALMNTDQKLKLAIATTSNIQVMGPSDFKIMMLQNNNWQTSLFLDKPTIYRGNYFEYNDDNTTSFPGLKEFRWVDMRSLRLLSDRIKQFSSHRDTIDVLLKPDMDRSGQPYTVYHDLNGSYTIETLESINPFWQGDYAYVHFTYIPPGNRALEGRDVYIFGEMTNWASDTTGKMYFDPAKGIYEKTLLLKEGYYSYLYATQPFGGKAFPDFSVTEGNYYGTENVYTILVYYRAFGSRADELIGFTSISSIFQRQGF